MANQDWLYRSAAPLYVAGKAANLSDAQQKQVNGLAWLSSVHKNLMKMDEGKSVEEFNKLDRKVQDSLTNIFGKSQYNPEDLGVLGTAAKYAKKALTGVSDVLTGYSEWIDRPWRSLMLVDDVGSFSEAWDKAADGKRLFDADRQEAIERFYDKETATIAKRISMGDTIGEIISDLKTDQEFRMMEKFLAGDETVIRAIRDYDQAKISIGRSFAHLFNLNPDVGAKSQGIEGKVYNAVSGMTDLAYNIVADPATWLFTPIAAYRKASMGMASLMRAQAGDLTTAQKVITKFGKKVGWDAAFEKESVRRAWDDIGSLLDQASRRNKSTDPVQKAAARRKIQEIMPTLDDSAIEELIKGKVKDADSALKFMKNTDAVMKIAVGKSGTRERLLPSYTKTLAVRKAISANVVKIIGVSKDAKVDDLAFKGTVFETIAQGQSAKGAAEVQEMVGAKSWTRRTAKMFERALIERSAYTGGYDDTGRSLRSKSAQSIYTLARTFFDKREADIVAKMYIGAESEGQARAIIEGLYRTMLDASGITANADGKTAADTLLRKWNDQKFSTGGYISEETGKAGGRGAGFLQPDDVDGQSLANAAYHIKHQIELPSIIEVFNVVHREDRWLSKSLGLRGLNHVATDLWSALNLLPRLGLRSVLDESLFSYLTMPVAVLQNSVRGYQAGVAQRFLSGIGGEKSVGIVARRFMRSIIQDVDEETLKQVAKDSDFAAQVLEENLTKGVLGKTLFAGETGKRYAKYVAQNVKYGYMSQVRGLSEGMSRAIATSEPAAAEKISSVLDISPELARQMRKDGIRLGGNVTKINKADSAFLSNANIQLINVVDRNDKVGKIAVAYMEDPQKAVKEIAKYLRSSEGKKFYRNFDRYNSKSTNVQSDAFSMYTHVRMNFTNDMDEINKGLLDKIRPNGFGSMDATAADIRIEDLSALQDGFRSELFGFGKEVQIFRGFSDYLEEAINNGFYIMDRQVATLSREPAVYSYMFWYRDQFAAVEKKYAKDWLAKNPDATPAMAEDIAARRFAALANDFAINRVLGYIDNPHVRSNLAFSARNIARYYRANEDFYRRAGRVLRSEGPQAVLRLRMANEGLDHAGFIHEDSQGDKYFTFPVDEIMYSVYSSIIGPILGVEVKRPMPLSLSGKIKMVTPSLDPESNLPTFSGPFISVAWSTFKNFLPEEHRDGFTRALFGQYAEGQSFWSAIEPSTIKRLRTAAKAATGMEDDQISSATMKAMAFYAANGMAPGADSTMAQREQFKYDVKVTARSLVFLRNMLGLISPVSPQFATINDIPKELLDNGAVPLKQEFQRLVQAEYDKGNTDAWNTALVKWTKIHPGRLVYTVSEAEANTVAPIRKTKEAVDWIKENRGLADKYREASVFLMPQASSFDLDAYAFLKREGFTQAKDLDKYFEEIANVVVENQYYDIKRKYEDIIDRTPSADVASAYRSEMDGQLAAIKESNPFLKRKFEQFDGSTQLKLDVVQNMQDALDSGLVRDNDTSRRIAKMLNVFNNGYANARNIRSQTDFASAERREVKAVTRDQLITIAGTNANAKLFYDVILKRLLD